MGTNTVTSFFTRLKGAEKRPLSRRSGSNDIGVISQGQSMQQAFAALHNEAKAGGYGAGGGDGSILTIAKCTDLTAEYIRSRHYTSEEGLGEYLDEQLALLGPGEMVGVCTREPEGTKPGFYAFAGWAS